jgi:two-component system nitrogen regulation response regulator GlnG
VGSNEPVRTNFRVIGATHQSLARCVAQGKFRHDLYFRLCAFELEVPSLRERADDIAELATHFASAFGAGPLTFSEATIEELRRRPWRGNVRELRNAIEHAAVLVRTGVVHPEHLPACSPATEKVGLVEGDGTSAERLARAAAERADELLTKSGEEGVAYQRILGEVEGPILRVAMERFGNECAPAARALGLHRTTLKRKLDEHGIP